MITEHFGLQMIILVLTAGSSLRSDRVAPGSVQSYLESLEGLCSLSGKPVPLPVPLHGEQCEPYTHSKALSFQLKPVFFLSPALAPLLHPSTA